MITIKDNGLMICSMDRENIDGHQEMFIMANGRVTRGLVKELLKSITYFIRINGEIYTGDWHNNHYHG